MGIPHLLSRGLHNTGHIIDARDDMDAASNIRRPSFCCDWSVVRASAKHHMSNLKMMTWAMTHRMRAADGVPALHCAADAHANVPPPSRKEDSTARLPINPCQHSDC